MIFIPSKETGIRDRAEKHARPDLAEVFGAVRNWPRHGAAVLAALDQIEYLGEPRPTLTEPPQRWLPALSAAFHSRYMAAVEKEFAEYLGLERSLCF